MTRAGQQAIAARLLGQQAAALAYIDLVWGFALVKFAAIPLVLMAKRGKPGPASQWGTDRFRRFSHSNLLAACRVKPERSIFPTFYFRAGQEKFAASFGSPKPLYFATAGYGHTGRVISTSSLVLSPAYLVPIISAGA